MNTFHMAEFMPLSVPLQSKQKLPKSDEMWIIHRLHSACRSLMYVEKVSERFPLANVSHFQYLFSLKSSKIRRDVDYSICFSLQIIDVWYNNKGSDITHTVGLVSDSHINLSGVIGQQSCPDSNILMKRTQNIICFANKSMFHG